MSVKNRHLFISCLFGEMPRIVHPAPSGTKSIFFSNDQELESEATQKGWDFRLVDVERFPLSSDSTASSLQAKYIKFMQFLDDYPELQEYNMITYSDHKPLITNEHLLWLMTRIESDKKLIVRQSPKEKNVYEEIRVATRQERYRKTMPQTIEWVGKQKETVGFDPEAFVSNTGIIHCVDVAYFRPMFDNIYKTIIELQQPECQIFWVILSQKYKEDIQQIKWHDMNIKWFNPKAPEVPKAPAVHTVPAVHTFSTKLANLIRRILS